MTKLVLGTAQLGMPYGVNGPVSGVSTEQARDILERALTKGVGCYDTAAGYGRSEQVLGKNLGNRTDVQIITKLRALQKDCEFSIEEQVHNSIDNSLKNLEREVCDGLLIHRTTDLLGPSGDAIWSTLEEERVLGRVQKIGVSVYDSKEVDAILERYSIDLIQLPLNIYDQRMLQSGHLNLLDELGVEIHVRSVFMQGLLLNSSKTLPEYFKSLNSLSDSLHRDAADAGATVLQVALAFIRSLPQVSAAVVGVDSVNQLDQILEQWTCARFLKLDYSRYAIEDTKLLNPSHWPSRESLQKGMCV